MASGSIGRGRRNGSDIADTGWMAERRMSWGDESDGNNEQSMEYQEVRFNKRKKGSMGDGSDSEQTNKSSGSRYEADTEVEGK